MEQRTIQMFGRKYPVIKWDNVLDMPFTIELPDGRQRSRIGGESLFRCRVCNIKLEITDYVTVCEKCDREDIKQLNLIELKIGDIVTIGGKTYTIDCSELYQMAGNKDGLFLQELTGNE